MWAFKVNQGLILAVFLRGFSILSMVKFVNGEEGERNYSILVTYLEGGFFGQGL